MLVNHHLGSSTYTPTRARLKCSNALLEPQEHRFHFIQLTLSAFVSPTIQDDEVFTLWNLVEAFLEREFCAKIGSYLDRTCISCARSVLVI